MLGRVAACAAFLYVWPICIQIPDGDGPLPLPQIVIANGQGQAGAAQRKDAETKNQPPPPDSGAPTSPAEPPQADAHAPAASKTAIALEAEPFGVSKAEPFGLDAEPVAAGEILAKWNGVEAQIRAESLVLARCREHASSCPPAAQRFLAIIDEGRAQTGLARIGVINRAVNLAIKPMSDLEQWGEIDHWSPPLETFTTGRGDCEDYAIAKYVALRAAGIADEDVKLVVVSNTAAAENHAVVAVRIDDVWMILDNRWLTMVRDRDIWRADPVAVLDETGVRRFTVPADAPVAETQSVPPLF
jgi:predicted transglutaminase-like cysteine proteinase